jgi:hypothetical protein
MSSEPPEYLEKFSTNQREKLFEFIGRADAIIGEGSFDSQDTWTDAELMALSLRVAQILGYENQRLEELFSGEFGLSGVTEGQLADWLTIIMLVDLERRIKVACGGVS